MKNIFKKEVTNEIKTLLRTKMSPNDIRNKLIQSEYEQKRIDAVFVLLDVEENNIEYETKTEEQVIDDINGLAVDDQI